MQIFSSSIARSDVWADDEAHPTTPDLQSSLFPSSFSTDPSRCNITVRLPSYKTGDACHSKVVFSDFLLCGSCSRSTATEVTSALVDRRDVRCRGRGHSASVQGLWLWHHTGTWLRLCAWYDRYNMGIETISRRGKRIVCIESAPLLTANMQVQTSEAFSTAGRTVKSGLVAAAVVSSWTWAATLLQSSGVAYSYGVSGPFWYASGATVQILLFATLAIEWVAFTAVSTDALTMP